MFREIPELRKHHPEPLVQIHPETATRLGIGEADWVWIETLRGKIRHKATLFDGINPRVVHAEHEWWFPEDPQNEPSLSGVWKANVNLLTANEPSLLDPGFGSCNFRNLLCRVYKV